MAGGGVHVNHHAGARSLHQYRLAFLLTGSSLRGSVMKKQIIPSSVGSPCTRSLRAHPVSQKTVKILQYNCANHAFPQLSVRTMASNFCFHLQEYPGSLASEQLISWGYLLQESLHWRKLGQNQYRKYTGTIHGYFWWGQLFLPLPKGEKFPRFVCCSELSILYFAYIPIF